MFTYTAFQGFHKLISSDLESVLLLVKRKLKAKQDADILIFSDSTGKQMDFDLSGSEAEVVERHKIFTNTVAPSKATVGRPKFGVVPREISLLPSHWEWLNNQPGGASATIRLLIDERVKYNSSEKLKIKKAQERTYKFLEAIAGNLPHFEEVIRYLYRSDREKYLQWSSNWPKDVLNHSLFLSEDVFSN